MTWRENSGASHDRLHPDINRTRKAYMSIRKSCSVDVGTVSEEWNRAIQVVKHRNSGSDDFNSEQMIRSLGT